MAEFCLDCWNKLNHTRLAKEDVILSDNFDLCEECAEFKPVVEAITPHAPRKTLRWPRKRRD